MALACDFNAHYLHGTAVKVSISHDFRLIGAHLSTVGIGIVELYTKDQSGLKKDMLVGAAKATAVSTYKCLMPAQSTHIPIT